MYKKLLIFFSAGLLYSCNNSTEPNDSNSLRLVLSSNKTHGAAPLTVKFYGKIEGNSEGITGQVPDYFFFSNIGRTIIQYSIPDTAQALNKYWSEEKIYSSAGEYKVVLLYQGRKDGESIELLSDTLLIKVN